MLLAAEIIPELFFVLLSLLSNLPKIIPKLVDLSPAFKIVNLLFSKLKGKKGEKYVALIHY